MDDAEEEMVGAGGTYVFALTGKMFKGECNLTAIKGRPQELESGGQPLEERTINIYVTSNCLGEPDCWAFGMPEISPNDKDDENPKYEFKNFEDWLACFNETNSSYECGVNHQ